MISGVSAVCQDGAATCRDGVRSNVRAVNDERIAVQENLQRFGIRAASSAAWQVMPAVRRLRRM
jgi:hypothetical protein